MTFSYKRECQNPLYRYPVLASAYVYVACLFVKRAVAPLLLLTSSYSGRFVEISLDE